MYAGGANFTSLFFMNVYRTYISLLFDSFSPLFDDLTKKGRGIWFIYAWFIYACLLTKKGENIWWFIYACLLFHFLVLLTKRGKRIFDLCMFIFSFFMHIYLFSLKHFIKYMFVYCYAWVKGELLWSLTLIHAYITPWVLSSSKGGRLFARGPSL